MFQSFIDFCLRFRVVFVGIAYSFSFYLLYRYIKLNHSEEDSPNE